VFPACSAYVFSCSEDIDEEFIKEAKQLVDKMTLKEKVDMVVGGGMDSITLESEFDAINLKKQVNGVAGYINGVESLDLPAVKVADGPAGLRIDPVREGTDSTFYTTAFPIATQISSTWDTELCMDIGKAIGNEVKEYGVDIWLAPALNIQRNPLCGRNFEYYSEDPLVSGEIAASIVKGVQSQNVGTAIKHYAANNSETNRTEIDTIVSERALREIYLKGFQIAIEKSNPWSVMSSYNKINGTTSSQNKELLTDILRKEWGFKGFVMTDWTAGYDPVKQMEAGNELVMPGNATQKEKILQAVENKELDESIVTQNAVRIMTQILKTPSYNNYNYFDKPELEENAFLSQKAATEGMVLLKNDGSLPISTSDKIASFGVGQILTIKGGTGSGDVHSRKIVNIIDGLSSEYMIDTTLKTSYETFIKDNSYENEVFVGNITACDEMPIPIEDIDDFAASNDIAVITISRISGEGKDRENIKGDFLLSDTEKSLIENVSTVFHEKNKKVVVILNIGGPIEIASWKDNVDGILLAWQPGQEAGYAVADLLTGKTNPSGKLAQTFPVKYDDNPSSTTFPGNDKETPTKIYYNDDIYVGYRYYSTFDVKPTYEFGYGLSYTKFKYSELELNNKIKENSKNKVSVDISLSVENTGDVSGKEVVQVYVSSPDGRINKPEIELKAFKKTKEILPENFQRISFKLNQNDLVCYDTENAQWIMEPGEYKVYVAPSSDIRNIKPLKFKVSEKIVVKKVSNKLSLKEEINSLGTVKN
jgi:beta-glucosidase